MKKIWKILFCKCNNTSYHTAVEKVAELKEKLQHPKSLMYKEIQIKIDF